MAAPTNEPEIGVGIAFGIEIAGRINVLSIFDPDSDPEPRFEPGVPWREAPAPALVKFSGRTVQVRFI
jgi:hypothetical protein